MTNHLQEPALAGPAPADERWICRFNTRPAPAARLICLPYAGGGAAVFRAWHEHLPETVEVCPVQLPGRETRFQEPPIDSLPALVAQLAPALRPLLDRPFAIYGHSMGALIGFALAQRLRADYGLAPTHLLVGARRAPQVPAAGAPVHQLAEDEFVDALRQRYNGIPTVLLQQPELLRLFLPILRADFKLLETYVYTGPPALECPVVVFGGAQDALVAQADLDAWAGVTSGPCVRHTLPGGHFFLQSHRDLLLAGLRACLAPGADGPF